MKRISPILPSFENMPLVGSHSGDDGDLCLTIEKSVKSLSQSDFVSRQANTKVYHNHVAQHQDICQFIYALQFFTMMHEMEDKWHIA